jgi:hypothetical protein
VLQLFFPRCVPTRAMAFSFVRFLDHIRRTTVGRTPTVEWSARRRDFWQHTTLTRDRHPCPRRDSNPQSQQASGRRPMPSSFIGARARCGLWPVEQCPSILSYLSPALSILSLPALEDLFLLFLSILSWAFPFLSLLPVLKWRSFWASYPPPFSPGDPTNLSFVHLSILLYIFL